jgi:RNA polymerase Rpb2, domain 6
VSRSSLSSSINAIPSPSFPLLLRLLYPTDLPSFSSTLSNLTGTNAVVAVIAYTGYDMEDAMIISKGSYQRVGRHSYCSLLHLSHCLPTFLSVIPLSLLPITFFFYLCTPLLVPITHTHTDTHTHTQTHTYTRPLCLTYSLTT